MFNKEVKFSGSLEMPLDASIGAAAFVQQMNCKVTFCQPYSCITPDGLF
jgi:hypothetical protein